MARLGTEEAYTIAAELKKLLPEVTNSPHILNMVDRLCSLLEPYAPTSDAIQDTVALKKAIEEAESIVKENKAALEKRKEVAQEEFIDRGISTAKVGTTTLYQAHIIRANIEAAKMQEACTAIVEHADAEDAGPTELVRFTINANSLTAWVREQERDENDMPILPKWLVPYVKIHSGYELRTRG